MTGERDCWFCCLFDWPIFISNLLVIHLLSSIKEGALLFSFFTLTRAQAFKIFEISNCCWRTEFGSFETASSWVDQCLSVCTSDLFLMYAANSFECIFWLGCFNWRGLLMVATFAFAFGFIIFFFVLPNLVCANDAAVKSCFSLEAVVFFSLIDHGLIWLIKSYSLFSTDNDGDGVRNGEVM